MTLSVAKQYVDSIHSLRGSSGPTRIDQGHRAGRGWRVNRGGVCRGLQVATQPPVGTDVGPLRPIGRWRVACLLPGR